MCRRSDFLGDFENRLFGDCDILPLIWWRYTDDIFMLCQHGEKKFKKFLEILNSYHSTIKFLANYPGKKISILDAKVIKKGNQLVAEIYLRPTDTHQYLHVRSCEFFHSKKSIPFSQALRLNRVCSETSFSNKQCNDLDIWLRERGFSDKLDRKQILKSESLRDFPEKLYCSVKEKKMKKDLSLILQTTHL